jgi:hypothetical protein
MAEQPVPGASMGFVGRWRILEMELWDADAFDLVSPAFIEFGSDLRGRFRFIVIDGWMDCRIAKQSGGAGVEFSRRAATKAMRSADGAGPLWLMTASSAGEFSSTTVTIRVSGRCVSTVCWMPVACEATMRQAQADSRTCRR